METLDLFADTPWSRSTSSAAAFPARTSASPARAPASKARAADCGPSTPALCESSDPVGSLLKTCLLSELEAMTGSRMTWKRQATPSGRSWWVLTTLARPTDESACGLLPTPKNSDHRSGMPDRYGPGERRSNLNDAVARMGLLPTPTRNDAESSGSRITPTSKAHPGVSLTDVIVRGYLPTPKASDIVKGGRSQALIANGGGQATHQALGVGATRLNPQFVAWMMGFPLDWCDIGDQPLPRSATRSSRKSRKRSGAQS